MPQWISVWFDEQRGYYRARWRTPTEDRRGKVSVPWLRNHSIDPDKPTERGDKLALVWATRFAPKQSGSGEEMDIAGLVAHFIRKNPERSSPATLKKARAMGANLAEYFDALPAGAITIAHAEDYRNHRLDVKKRRARTVGNELAFLRQLLIFGLEREHETGITALKLVRVPAVGKDAAKGIALTEQEVCAMLRAHLHRDTDRVRRIMTVGIATMLRRRPLLGLRWEWIDAKRRWLDVPGKFQKGGQTLSVPLSEWAIEAMGEPKGSGYVFPNPRTRGATKTIEGSLKTLAVTAGARRCNHHDLRRTGYTWLAEAGIEKVVRKVLMGHALTDVSDGYDRSFVKRMEAAVAVFDGIARAHLRDCTGQCAAP